MGELLAQLLQLRIVGAAAPVSIVVVTLLLNSAKALSNALAYRIGILGDYFIVSAIALAFIGEGPQATAG